MERRDIALSQLIDNILDLSKDDASSASRRNYALQRCRNIVDRQSTNPNRQDIHQIGDLIKKRLWRKHGVPDRASRFNKIHAQVAALPILKQKAGIFQLLYGLSDISSTEDGEAKSNRRRSVSPSSHATGSRPSSAFPHRAGAQSFDDERPTSKSRNNGLEAAALKNELSYRSNQGIGSTHQSQAQHAPNASDAPSMEELLRDLPFTLQGVSSKNLVFSDSATLTISPNLPITTISILNTLAEPAILYKGLAEFVESDMQGLIVQSLRSAIGSELNSYLSMIASIESEIRENLDNTQEGESAAPKVGTILKRCVVWLKDATLGLRFVRTLADVSATCSGGQLISKVHKFSTSHGDPFVNDFAERMLSSLTQPFYDMLRKWIYDGELSDLYNDFFVSAEDPNAEPADGAQRGSSNNVWEDKFKVKEDQIPSIISQDLAQKIYLIGKSLNFLRYNCGDSAWVEAHSKSESRELRYGDTSQLEMSIDSAYKLTMHRLIGLMNSKFNLFDHLGALKRYLLLGQGDFIALLMESLASSLDRPAGSQYRHTLTAQLEHSIRGSNARYDSPEILKRLDARLLELSHGEIGWDVFTLEYKVDSPADVVVTPWANKQYLVIFNFLWRIKRVEFAIGNSWRKFATGARGVLASLEERLASDWKTTRTVLAEMIHFITQLQYYVLFEVIESSWHELDAAIHKDDCTLDDLIAAHAKYLRSITHKGLLGSVRSSITGTREDSFTHQLHNMLKTVLAYRDAADGLYSYSLTVFTKKQALAAKIELRTAAGQWGTSDRDSIFGDDSPASSTPSDPHARPSRAGAKDSKPRPRSKFVFDDPSGGFVIPPLIPTEADPANSSYDDSTLPALRVRLNELATDFHARLGMFLGDLAVQSDQDLRFLGQMMNFNEVYRPVRRKRAKPTDESVLAKGAAIHGPGSTAKEEKDTQGREKVERKA